MVGDYDFDLSVCMGGKLTEFSNTSIDYYDESTEDQKEKIAKDVASVYDTLITRAN